MQTYQKNVKENGSHGFHNQQSGEKGVGGWSPSEYVDHYLCSPDGSQDIDTIAENAEQLSSLDQSPVPGACSLSSSLSSGASQQNSQTFQSYQYDSPDNTSSSAASESYVSHKLRELATEMLGPDHDNLDSDDNVVLSGSDQMTLEARKWSVLAEMVARGDLKEVLCACARSIESNDSYTFELLVSEARKMVSVSGDPLQRLGAYMLEGLVARLASSGSAIYKSLKCQEPTGNELFSYMYLLYDVCPYFKFGNLSANGAIAQAMKDESRVHVIDFQISQGGQWITLIQALAGRPGGPPHIRITGIDDSRSAFVRGGGLHIVGERLRQLAEQHNVPFEFTAADVSASEVEFHNLGIRPGEAIAVNFPLMLHHLIDESVGTENCRDKIIRLVKSLSPKVVTLVEQESNTNTAPFVPRFVQTMNHYLAIFESIDVILARDHKERINIEQHCLAREVVNIIACEGAERVERHELFGKWRSRFTMAGFSQYPLNSFVNATIKSLLENYSNNYTLEERDGTLYLGWRNLPLITSSAWK